MNMTKDNNKRNAVQQKLLAELQSLSEVKYKEFSEKLSPGVAMLGVRNPIVRKLAQKYLKHEDPALLLQPLPLDSAFEERFCRAVFIAKIPMDVEKRLTLIKEFLPFINGWAICDCLCSLLKECKTHMDEYYSFVKPLFLHHNKPFDMRFACVMALDYFAKDEYLDEGFELIEKVDTSEYYVHMGAAWAIATFYCKCNKDKVTKKLISLKTDNKTYNKALQKIRESYLPTEAEKEFIKTLKRK